MYAHPSTVEKYNFVLSALGRGLFFFDGARRQRAVIFALSNGPPGVRPANHRVTCTYISCFLGPQDRTRRGQSGAGGAAEVVSPRRCNERGDVRWCTPSDPPYHPMPTLTPLATDLGLGDVFTGNVSDRALLIVPRPSRE